MPCVVGYTIYLALSLRIGIYVPVPAWKFFAQYVFRVLLSRFMCRILFRPPSSPILSTWRFRLCSYHLLFLNCIRSSVCLSCTIVTYFSVLYPVYSARGLEAFVPAASIRLSQLPRCKYAHGAQTDTWKTIKWRLGHHACWHNSYKEAKIENNASNSVFCRRCLRVRLCLICLSSADQIAGTCDQRCQIEVKPTVTSEWEILEVPSLLCRWLLLSQEIGILQNNLRYV